MQFPQLPCIVTMATLVYWSLHSLKPSVPYHHKSCIGIDSEKVERNCACVLQSCPDAIDEVFDSKLHVIGGVGITIGVVMVSV